VGDFHAVDAVGEAGDVDPAEVGLLHRQYIGALVVGVAGGDQGDAGDGGERAGAEDKVDGVNAHALAEVDEADDGRAGFLSELP
jgi:hypothetical protein